MAGLYGSRVIPLDWHWRAYRSTVRQLLQAGSRGLIIWTERRTPIDDLLEGFRSKQVPAVTVGRNAGPGNHVAMDAAAAARTAVAHLVQLGHAEIACFGLNEVGRAMAGAYRVACQEHSLERSARRILFFDASAAEIAMGLEALRSGHREVTAIFFSDMSIARLFVEEPTLARTVPREFSVVAYGNPEVTAHADPPLTIVAEDYRRIGRHAAGILFGQMAEALKTGVLPPPERLLIEPQLIVRGSTAAPLRVKRSAAMRTAKPFPHLTAEPQDSFKKTRRSTGPYAALRKARPENFLPLDLRPCANRSLRRFKSWLGGWPLLHFPAGRQKIHGVPFEIIDEETNRRRGVIVLRSRHAREQSLPSSVEIKVPHHAARLYFLHGCGWAKDHVKSAEYQMIYEDLSQISVGLVPYGFGPSDKALAPQWRRESNIQDWWPSYPQFENERVRHLAVTKDGDPEGYEHYLYTLEWINPEPRKKLKAIRVGANLHSSFTLGILAITLFQHE